MIATVLSSCIAPKPTPLGFSMTRGQSHAKQDKVPKSMKKTRNDLIASTLCLSVCVCGRLFVLSVSSCLCILCMPFLYKHEKFLH